MHSGAAEEVQTQHQRIAQQNLRESQYFQLHTHPTAFPRGSWECVVSPKQCCGLSVFKTPPGSGVVAMTVFHGVNQALIHSLSWFCAALKQIKPHEPGRIAGGARRGFQWLAFEMSSWNPIEAKRVNLAAARVLCPWRSSKFSALGDIPLNGVPSVSDCKHA